MRMRLVVPFLFAFLTCAAHGAGPETATVASVVDGDTVVLEAGGEVRLVGIQAPKLALGRPDFTDWPLAEEAKAALAELSQGRRVALVVTGRGVDRHGRRLAHVERDDGLWLQRAMLERGLARVYTFADNRARVPELLAAERAARADRRGIWALPYYRIRTPERLGDAVDTFQLVEGRVVDAAIVRGRGYLNFGDDYRTDFTVTVAPDDMDLFEEAGIDLRDLEGANIRVRGWITYYNGPMIEATHPEQIERLD